MHRVEDKEIHDALALLNEAARDNRTELQTAMSHKYTDLSAVMSTFAESRHNGAFRRFEAGKQRAMEIAHDVDESVHTNPWPYIGGVAAAALLSGFLIGRLRRE